MKEKVEQNITKETEKNKDDRLRKVIIVLLILLVASLLALGGRYLYLNLQPDNTGTSSGNRIEEVDDTKTDADTEESGQSGESSGEGSSQAAPSAVTAVQASETKLELYSGQPEVNAAFNVENMLPGDKERRFFCVKAYHEGDITVYFEPVITSETKNLSEVIKLKVKRLDARPDVSVPAEGALYEGTVLCQGTLRELSSKEFSHTYAANIEGISEVWYEIEASLDTSVGNPYKNAFLAADFRWYVKDEGSLKPPKTGDLSNPLLWAGIGVAALLILIILIKNRKKEDDGDETGK